MTTPTGWVELTASCGRCDNQDSVSVPVAKYTEWRARQHLMGFPQPVAATTRHPHRIGHDAAVSVLPVQDLLGSDL